jgi:hypothetical protein
MDAIPPDKRPLPVRRLVTRREVVLVLAWAVSVMGLTVLPYVWAIRQTAEGRPLHEHQFQGFLWGVDEGNVYLTWMRQAAEGAVLLRNQYTTMPQNPHFLNVFLVALGRLSALTGQPGAVVFHAARLLGGVFLLLCIYLLTARLTAAVAARWATLCLASLGSGFGWLAAMWARSRPAYLPPPLQTPDYAPPLAVPRPWQAMPEAVTFPSLLLNPLFVWSMGLLCLVFLAAITGVERNRSRYAAAAGLLLLLLGNVHGYDIFVVHAALVLYLAVSVAAGKLPLRRAVLHYAIVFVVALPSPAWAWYTSRVDPAYLAKISTATRSPGPVDYAAGYGLIFLLALVGIGYVWRVRRLQHRLLFPVCWLVSNAALVYAPVSFQRKMAEGMHIPLCMLAALGLVMVVGQAFGARLAREPLRQAQVRARWMPLLIGLAVALALPSNVLFVADCLEHAAANNRDLLHVLAPPMYLSWDEVRALDYLARHTGPADVVLSSSLLGSHIPAHAPCTVFAGHWAETLDFHRLLPWVGEFLLPEWGDRRRLNFLSQAGIDYVYYGPEEVLVAEAVMRSSGLQPPEDLAADFRDSTASLLTPVFANDEVTIYRFEPRRRYQ